MHHQLDKPKKQSNLVSTKAEIRKSDSFATEILPELVFFTIAAISTMWRLRVSQTHSLLSYFPATLNKRLRQLSCVKWGEGHHLDPSVWLCSLTGVTCLHHPGQHLEKGKCYVVYTHTHTRAHLYTRKCACRNWFCSQTAIWNHLGNVSQGHWISLKCIWKLLQSKASGDTWFIHLWFNRIWLLLFALYSQVVVIQWRHLTLRLLIARGLRAG